MKKSVLLSALLGLLCIAGFAQTANYWIANETGRSNLTKDKAVSRATFPSAFKLFSLNTEPLKQALFAAVDNRSASGRPTVISLPNAAGSVEDFEVYEASNFEPALQARFPEIRAFSGKGITDKAATLKLSFSPQGIQTVVFRTGKENEFIEPYSQDHRVYAVFAVQPAQGDLPWSCTTPNEQMATNLNQQMGISGTTSRSGSNVKTMRLALSASGAYARYFGATDSSQVGLVLAAVNATLTHCNGVFERDLALHLNLIASSTKVFYYDGLTDPYSAPYNWNDEVQSTLSTVIGEANYDIGHMFIPFQQGGNAGCIGCICENGSKGMGWSSTVDGIPKGNDFDCVVMHEMGHQMGANHSFSTQIEGTGANKELGAGTTIMSYAKSTGPRVAIEWMDVYHEHSIAQIEANLAAKTCPVTTTITNATPIVAALSNYTIPKSTPFALTGAATDANAGDVLTYSWEQNDDSYLCCDNSVAYPTKEIGPNWISFRPTTSPTRYFPQLSTILAGGLVTGPVPGGNVISNIEALSSISRTLNFRLTVRDNAVYRSTVPISVGQTASTDVAVMVNAASGPFVVTAPNTALIWLGGSSQTVIWDVAGTMAAPVSCANVKISLSTDGGQTFPTVLAASTPNDGTQVLTIPNIPSTTARIKVEAIGNIFLDISNTNFTIIDGQKPYLVAGSTTITGESCAPGYGNGVIDPGESVTVNFCIQNTGGVATTNLVGILQNTGGVTFASGQRNYGAVPTGGSQVCRTFTFTASGTCGSTVTASINFQDGATNLGTLTYTFTLGVLSSTLNTVVLTNSNAITIPATTVGPATPYSSNITVSGISNQVKKVTVQLTGLNHTYPDHLNILLVSPSGQKIILMSDVGGGTDVTNANLIFDDAASASVPDTGVIPSNITTTYKPTDIFTRNYLPLPAPADPYVTTLSTLNDLNPNGTWKLFVADDAVPDGGSISGGWTLNISTTAFTCCVTPPPVITSPTVTQPTCTTSTGTIVVNATGSSTLEYSVDNGANWQLSNTFSGLIPGNYTIKVRQQTNPANSATYTSNPVFIYAAPATPDVPVVTVTQPTCMAATGTITVITPTGLDITYSINNITYQVSSVFSNLTPGNYTVFAKNSSGCLSSASVIINTQPATPATPSVSVTQPTCTVATGTITITNPVGTSITYSIDGTNYQTSSLFSNVASGNYNLTVKNSSGCTSSISITINAQPATPATPSVTVTQPTCTVAIGSIRVNSPSGSGITYSIDGINYQASTAFSSVPSGNYTLTVKNSSGCISSTSVIINAAPEALATPTVNVTQPSCSFATGTITVSAPTGTGLTYSFFANIYQSSPTFSGVPPGSYSIRVKNSSGCISLPAPVTINPQPASPVAPTVSVIQPTCSIPTGIITVNMPTGEEITYSINGSDYQTNNVFSNLSSGNYSVTAKNGSGCLSAATPVTINVQPATPGKPIITASGPTTFCPGSSVTLTANAAVSYQWSNGNTTQSITVNQSGSYSVVVTNSDGCSSPVSDTTTIMVVDNEKPVITCPAAQQFCSINAGIYNVPALQASDNCGIQSISYVVSGATTRSGNNNNASGTFSIGTSTITWTVTDAGNNVSTCAATVTINPLPAAPAIANVTAYQGTGDVILTAPDCTGTLVWINPNGTTGSGSQLTVSTATPGTYTYQVACQGTVCTSLYTTVTVTVLSTLISVSHLDGDNNNPVNNIIKPYLRLNNESGTAVPYRELSIRYWLTAENYAPFSNLSVYYAQLGTNNVNMKYVKTSARQGAFGYVEYTFKDAAGNLPANNNSGPIQSGIGKQDWSLFNETDDYSFAPNTAYTKTTKITVYRNGSLIWGTEPAPVAPVTSLATYAQNQNSATNTNNIKTYLKVNNEGTRPVAYKDITVRYWFTADGTSPLNYNLDYAQLGNNNVTGSFVKLASPVVNADTYLQLSFPNLTDSLYPISSTGNIQQRINKQDWSAFNETNDHSFKVAGPMALNTTITIYIKGQLVFGTEPIASSMAKTGLSPVIAGKVTSITPVEVAEPFNVKVLQNPLEENDMQVVITGAKGQSVNMQLADASGRLLTERLIKNAGATEFQRLRVPDNAAQIMYLRVSTGKAFNIIKVMKAH